MDLWLVLLFLKINLLDAYRNPLNEAFELNLIVDADEYSSKDHINKFPSKQRKSFFLIFDRLGTGGTSQECFSALVRVAVSQDFLQTSRGKTVSTGNVLEGDMLVNATDERQSKNASKATKWLDLEVFVGPWLSHVIPFIIDPEADFNRHERCRIRDALLEFHQHTCLRFVRRTDEADFLFITTNSPFKATQQDGDANSDKSKIGPGCHSYVGRRGGQQAVYLGAPECVSTVGAVLHHLMHSLGFPHEHTRFGGNKSVQDNWAKSTCLASEMGKCTAVDDGMNNMHSNPELLNEPYNHGSAMDRELSNGPLSGREKTLPQKSPAQTEQRLQLSDDDVRKLNLEFKCHQSHTPGKNDKTAAGNNKSWNTSGAVVANKSAEIKVEMTVSSYYTASPAIERNDPCSTAGWMPDFGIRLGKHLYIGKGERMWEFVETVKYSGQFIIKSLASTTLRSRLDTQLPNHVSTGVELDDELYFFKDDDVWMMSGRGKSVVDQGKVNRMFPEVNFSSIRGVFRTGDILTFSNGTSISMYNLLKDTLDERSTESKRLNQRTGWPDELVSFFDTGANRLLIFTKDKVYLTMQDGFPIEYGYPKMFKETFCPHLERRVFD